jgi:hypothetical protein
VADVREGFWIPDVNSEHVKQVFWPWCTGLAYLDRWETLAWIVVVVVCVGWTVLGWDAGGWFFLLQAALPWGCAITLSVLWKRSIFYDRYLSFAQWALLCYWGTVCARLGDWRRGTSGDACATGAARLVLGAFIAASAVAGTDWNVSRTGGLHPPLAQAGEFLKEHARAGDQVWVSGAAEVNRVRYYASQAGLPNLWVRGHVSLGQRGTSSTSPRCAAKTSSKPTRPRTRPNASGKLRRAAPMHRPEPSRSTFRDDASQYSVALYERIRKK